MAAIQQAAQTGQLDIQTAATLIARANPNASPRDIVAALNVAMPYLKAEEQMQVAKLRLDLAQQKEMDVQRYREDTIGIRERALEQAQKRSEETERHHKETEEATQKRLDQSQQRIVNLEAHRQFERDLQLKNITQKQIEAERRFAQSGRAEDDREAKRLADLGMKRAQIILQSHSFMSDLTDAQRSEIQGQAESIYKSYKDRLEMEQNQRGGGPPGIPRDTGAQRGGGTRPLLSSEVEWFKQQQYSPEERARRIKDLQDAGFDTSGL
jgi:hypothetical protein